MSLVERLKQYMEHIGMPSTQFADEANIARPTISQILNGRNRKISNELLEKLHEGFPTLNIMWLLFGDGDMEVKPNTQTSRPQNTQNLFTAADQSADYQEEEKEETAKNTDDFQFRSSNIEEFVEENTRNRPIETEYPSQMQHIQQMAASNRDARKRIQSIMVFYTDNSFEIFTPSPQ